MCTEESLSAARGNRSIYKCFAPAGKETKSPKSSVVEDDLQELEEGNRGLKVGEYTEEEMEMLGNGELHKLLAVESDERGDEIEEDMSGGEDQVTCETS